MTETKKHLVETRKKIVKSLREEGKPFSEIGKVLGVTRQRAQQIYKQTIAQPKTP